MTCRTLRSRPSTGRAATQVLGRYRIDDAAKKALEENDVAFFAQRVNPYLLRFYCFGIGMKDEELMRRLRDG